MKHYQGKEFIASVHAYSRAIAFDRENELAWFNRGLARIGNRDLKGARMDFNKSIKIKDNFSSGHIGLGIWFLEKKKYAAALKSFDKAISIDSGSYQAYFNKCIVYFNLSLYHEAMEEVSKALDIYPDFSEALVYKGLIFYQNHKFGEALMAYDEAIRSNPEFAMAYYDRALAKIKLDYLSSACQDLEKAKNLGYLEAEAVILINCNK